VLRSNTKPFCAHAPKSNLSASESILDEQVNVGIRDKADLHLIFTTVRFCASMQPSVTLIPT
jgi:hypothetical protein